MDYATHTEEQNGLENSKGDHGWMYDVGKTKETPNAKGLAEMVNKNFAHCVENFNQKSQT